MNALALAALRQELLTDPAGRGYAGKTPAEMAELVNSPFVEPRDMIATDVSTAEVKQIITPTGELFRIARQAEADDTLPITQAAWSFIQSIDRFNTISTSKPDIRAAAEAAIDALVAAELLGAGSASAIKALMTMQPPDEVHDARILRVMLGIADAPNAVTAADVEEALS